MTIKTTTATKIENCKSFPLQILRQHIPSIWRGEIGKWSRTLFRIAKKQCNSVTMFVCLLCGSLMKL